MGGAPLRILRILIVDDSPEDRELYRRLLAGDPEHAFAIVEKESGEEGLAWCLEERPDCVLLDYLLPDLDGLEFLQQVTTTDGRPLVPVIVLTGRGSEHVAVEAMKHGAQDYLLKNEMSRAALVPAILHAIERVELLQQIERRTAELARANTELQREIEQRREAEAAVQRMYQQLERLVIERTAELSRTNAELVREVAERKRAEEERARLLVREQEANRLKDEFLATVSHELRTPLNALLGWTRLLRTGALNPASRERALESIERNARTQARLIDDLLEVSRIVTGKLRLTIEPVDAGAVVEAALETVRPAGEAKGIQITSAIQPPPTRIAADANRLQQVVWNLLSNALKFTPAGGRIHVELTHTDTQIDISVADTGVGIDPAFLPHVFELFRQADASTTRQFGGLGLGLAIVHQIVALHGGSVEARSEGVNRGATFRVTLPTIPLRVSDDPLAPPATAPGTPRSPAAAPDLAGVRVLVLDDGSDSRDLTSAVLSYYRADVRAIDSLDALAEAIRAFGPHVVVTALPPDLGAALVRMVHQAELLHGARIRILGLGAPGMPEDEPAMAAAGYRRTLVRPLDPLELAQAVGALAQETRALGSFRNIPQTGS